MTDVPPPRRAPRIAHVGIAVRALDEILPFYRDLLGFPEVPLDDADGARIAGLAAGESLVELLEGQSPDSPIGKFVARRGPITSASPSTISTAPSPVAAPPASASSTRPRASAQKENGSPFSTPAPRPGSSSSSRSCDW
jgi:catechol 2,3-dioxygenase-like lactoylglutathione lyase family enzyme